MIQRINILGQIGNSYDKDGNISTKGLLLQDIVMQVESNKLATSYEVWINSGGGDVATGKAIAQYLSSLENVRTIANELCGSIATEIHLSVPLAFRKIVAGTEYFIHNPLLDGVSGNSEELKRAAELIEPYEREMLAMYQKSTGLNKEALKGLMAQSTSLTSEQAITLGFASEILPKAELKPIAFYNSNNTNQNKIDMTKVEQMFADLKKMIANKSVVKATMVTTDKGELTYESEGTAPIEGEVVMIGDAVAPEGEYKMDDETIIVVGADGVVASVTAPQAATETIESLKAKIAEMEAAQAVAVTEAVAIAKAEAEASMETQLNELKASMETVFVPKAAKPEFNKGAKKVLSFKDKLTARKELYKK